MAQSQNEIKFLHFRFPRLVETPFGVYAQGVDPRGGVTIAYMDTQRGTFLTGQAACSTNDNYVKEIGRQLAADRLLNGNHEFQGETARMDEKDFLEIAERTMERSGLFRKYSRKNRRNR